MSEKVSFCSGVQYVCVCVYGVCFIPVLHALVHAAVLDTLLFHVGAASSQTPHRLL